MSGCKSFKWKGKSPKPFRVYKSGYILALVNKKHLLEIGVNKIEEIEIYYKLMDYNGTPEGETCALLGIPKRYWKDCLSDDNIILRFIQTSPYFSHINMIENCTMKHIVDQLQKFSPFLERATEDECLLFNIEPKGEGKYETQYPVPRICIPGGGMEEDDQNNFENCAFREFKEETGLDIKDSVIIVSSEKYKRTKKQKKCIGNASVYFSQFEFKHFRQKPKPQKDKSVHISIYFFVEIVSLSSCKI